MTGEFRDQAQPLSGGGGLHAEEQRLQTLIDAAPVAIIQLSPQGRIGRANPYFTTLTGFALDEIIGKDWFETFVPETSRAARRALFDNHLGGIPLPTSPSTRNHTSPIVLRNGEMREIEWASSVIRSADGTAQSVLTIGVDVTEARKFEARRDRHTQRLQAILDHVAAFIGLFSPDGIVLEANRYPLKLAGIERDAVLGKPFWETPLWSASARSQVQLRHAFERAAAGETVRNDVECRIAGNRTITMDTVFAPLRDEQGRITEIIGSGLDVTERNAAAAELHKSEDLLRAAAQAAGMGIFDHDHRTNAVYWSSEQRANYGLDDEQEITPAFYLSRIHPEDRDRTAAIVSHAQDADSDGRFDIEHRIIRSDGAVRWLLTRGRTSFEGSGNARRPVRTVGTVFDITERLQVQEELRRSLAEKETLLREIHHRVKNNLQIVSSLLYFQNKKAHSLEEKTAIADSRERLRAMILVHEKLYQASNLSQVEFGAYLRTLITQLAISYRPRDGRVAFRIEAEDCTLPVETALPCGMIVCELLINAFKYAFPEPRLGEVLVRVAKTEAGLTLIVSDNGIGLPPGFDPQVSTSFGWHLVNSLAQQIGGSLTVARDSGTAVTVSFSAREAP